MNPPAPVPQIVCPDCRKASKLAAVTAMPAFDGFLTCPRCEVGSPAGEWTAPKISQPTQPPSS